MDLPPEFLTYQAKSAELQKIDSGLDAILKRSLGQDWLIASSGSEDRILTPRQQAWRTLRCFYNASIVNSGDLFSYLPMVFELRELFQEIGATGILAAAETLRPLHEKYTELPTAEAREEFWHQTREQRCEIESTSESMIEFADLLLQFARRYPEEFPEGEVEPPFARFDEMLATLRRKDTDGAHTEQLDLTEKLIDMISGKLRPPDHDAGSP